MGQDNGTPEGQARLSFRAAARLAGVSEKTMRRWAAAGRITARSDDDGRPWVDRQDVLRLGSVRVRPAAPAARGVPSEDTRGFELAELRVKVAALERENGDLRTQRDSWQAMAERLALAPAPATQQPQEPARRSWLARLLGR